MQKTILYLLLIVLLMATGCSGQQKSSTAAFPVKPIEMIVPFAAGGSTDQIARSLEKAIKKYLPNGQAVVVVNKPGGASVVGATEVSRAKPDGYKIGMVPPGPISMQPHFGNAPYTYDSFQGVIRLASSPMLFAVRADAPWQSFREWLDFVKQNPDQFIYGSGGVGNPPQAAMEKFARAQGLKLKYVPFEGTSQAYTALLGGHIQGELASSQEIKGQVDSGQIKILANFGDSKHDFYEPVPTLKELGFEPALEAYYGIVAPKGLPEPVLKVLHDSFKKAIEDPEVVEVFKKAGIRTDYAGPDAFQRQIIDQSNQYRDFFKEMGLTK